MCISNIYVYLKYMCDIYISCNMPFACMYMSIYISLLYRIHIYIYMRVCVLVLVYVHTTGYAQFVGD